MSIIKYILNMKRLLCFQISHFLFQKIRIIKYNILSNCFFVKGKPQYNSPALLTGNGKVIFEGIVNLGTKSSPFFYNSYIYIEARNLNSIIKIEDGVWINNNATIISEGEGIHIGKDTLIGFNFSVFDSDFHNISPFKRNDGSQKTSAVIIKSNVFIGSNVTILKGVIIGENTVIASGSVVTKSIPSNVVAGGNPCKIIKNIAL